MRLLTSLAVIVMFLHAAPYASGAEGDVITPIRALCAQTIAALRTPAVDSLIKLFSSSAGGFLAEIDGEPVAWSLQSMGKIDEWADRGIFSAAARIEKLKATDRLYATSVQASIVDGDKRWVLDGIAVYGGKGAKWMMLALLPQVQLGKERRSQLQAEALQVLTQWLQAVAAGEWEEVARSMALHGFSFSVVGPDMGFYVFTGRDELMVVLSEAAAQGPISLTLQHQPEVIVSQSLAIVRCAAALRVDAMEPGQLLMTIHMYQDEEGWQIMGLSGLPQVENENK